MSFPLFFFSTASVRIRGIDQPHENGTGVEAMSFDFVERNSNHCTLEDYVFRGKNAIAGTGGPGTSLSRGHPDNIAGQHHRDPDGTCTTGGENTGGEDTTVQAKMTQPYRRRWYKYRKRRQGKKQAVLKQAVIIQECKIANKTEVQNSQGKRVGGLRKCVSEEKEMNKGWQRV